MIPADLSPLANHIWQSTLFAVVIWLLTLSLKKNRSAVRYRLWLAASVKFLIPFALLVDAGSQLHSRSPAALTQSYLPDMLDGVSRPFVTSAEVSPVAATPPATSSDVSMILLGVWVCGLIVGLIFWLRSVLQIRAIARTSAPLNLSLPIPVVSSSARSEPGVFGIRRPILILPAGITGHLTPAQLEAVLAHELCHVRRRDNLTAAIHMIVERIFWFHPLVWWIGRQLVAAREQACDEEVVRQGNEPEIYAEGILNVCKFYLESPAIFVAGVTGSDLRKRIDGIMSHSIARRLGTRKKLVLATAGIAAVAGPVLVGLATAPQSRAQSQAASANGPSFEVASVKPGDPSKGRTVRMLPGGRFATTNASLRMLIGFAFDVRNHQISAGPNWLDSAKFDIEAKAGGAVRIPPGPKGAPQMRSMVQSLLADRFKLVLHRETRQEQVYELVAEKGGPKLKQAKITPFGGGIQMDPRGRLTGIAAPMSLLVNQLSRQLERSVIDKTGLTGAYDFKLEWTQDQDISGDTLNGPDAPAQADSPGPSIFTAVREQLGLRLQPARGPVEVLVIDHVEKPSPN